MLVARAGLNRGTEEVTYKGDYRTFELTSEQWRRGRQLCSISVDVLSEVSFSGSELVANRDDHVLANTSSSCKR